MAPEAGVVPDPDVTARVAWLERFYDLVFVAAVGRFANELGTKPDLAHIVTVLGWLVSLWFAWFLVTLRLNRFPDDGWGMRTVVVIQLLATTVATAAAISVTTTVDNTGGYIATACIGLGITLLYVTIPRHDAPDRRLVVAPAVGSLAVSAAILLSLVAPRPVATSLAIVIGIVFVVVLLAWYLPRLAVIRPVDPHHAADRHAQLFMVLMGLSFLKVAFATDPKHGVEYGVIVAAFAVGFAFWTMYIDGVLSLGFPMPPSTQRTWLVAQLLLSIGITVAAASVIAFPPTGSGVLTHSGALLEGGSIVAVLGAFAVLAATAARPERNLVVSRSLAAAAVVVVTLSASVVSIVRDDAFSGVLALVIVGAAIVDGFLRSRTQNERQEAGGGCS